jgi:hypothetical protein
MLLTREFYGSTAVRYKTAFKLEHVLTRLASELKQSIKNTTDLKTETSGTLPQKRIPFITATSPSS